jgi:hypothetical protein
MTVKNICFIHSTNINITGTSILDMLIYYLIDSELIDKLEYIVVNNIGIPVDEEKYKQINKKIIVINFSEDSTLFENATMKQVVIFSKLNENYNILYLHTKGVSYTPDHYFYPGIISWIHYMLYALIDESDKCIKLLNSYDTIGVNIKENDQNPTHYSGNFWWGRTSYLKKLSPDVFKDKYDCEFLTLSKNPKYFNIYTLPHMYQNVYSVSDYNNKIKDSLNMALSSLDSSTN